jgi:hypothetical protein
MNTESMFTEWIPIEWRPSDFEDVEVVPTSDSNVYVVLYRTHKKKSASTLISPGFLYVYFATMITDSEVKIQPIDYEEAFGYVDTGTKSNKLCMVATTC